MRRDESGVLGVSMAFSAGHAEENSQWMCCFERNRPVCENLAFLHRWASGAEGRGPSLFA